MTRPPLAPGQHRRRPVRRVSDKRAAREGRIYRTIASTTPMRKRSAKGSRFAHRRIKGYPEFIRTFGLCEARIPTPWKGASPHNPDGNWVIGKTWIPCRGRIECAHVVHSRGAAGDDLDGCVPLCLTHHRQLDHHIGPEAFAELYRLDLAASAKTYGDAWRRAHPETEDA